MTKKLLNPLCDPEVIAELRVLEHQRMLYYAGSVDVEFDEEAAQEEMEEEETRHMLERAMEQLNKQKKMDSKDSDGGSRYSSSDSNNSSSSSEVSTKAAKVEAAAADEVDSRGATAGLTRQSSSNRCPVCFKSVCFKWNYRRNGSGGGRWYCLKVGYVD